jgi:hypothetical protein
LAVFVVSQKKKKFDVLHSISTIEKPLRKTDSFPSGKSQQEPIPILFNYLCLVLPFPQRIKIQQARARAQLETLPRASTVEFGIELHRFPAQSAIQESGTAPRSLHSE